MVLHPENNTAHVPSFPLSSPTCTQSPLLTIRDEHQTTTLTQFRSNLESANLAPATPEARQAKASEIGYDRYDDQTLLRFLRARKFDLPKAQIMWEANEKWRKEFGTDEIAA